MSTSREKWNVSGNADYSKFLAVHLSLMEEFLQFCYSKKGKSDHFPINLNAEPSGGNSFKEKVVMYFGEYLPSDVIDELCKLVAENSYGKCHFCMLPTESLVLSVLQILLDASNKIADTKDGNCPMKSPPLNANIDINVSTMNKFSVLRGSNAENAQRSIGRRSNQNIYAEDCLHPDGLLFPSTSDHPHGEAGIRFQHIGEDTIFSVDCQGEFVEAMCPGNQDTHNLLGKAAPIIETPRVMNARKDNFNESVGHQEPAAPFKKRLRQDAPMNLINPLGRKEFEMGDIEPGNKAQEKRGTSVIQNAPPPQVGLVCRFPISDKELRYYKIICGLAHSQWRMFHGIQFFKTTVTYQSLGESVEPYGHVDNFFIAAVCRKYFEDHHPRLSKKHYFYPRIGACLLSYSSISDFKVLKNSFLGANAANKLHLSDKLCFPIYYEKHWFVFIVDLRNKYFAFLDSYYNQNDMYQIQVRNSLVTSFKQCWYEHAEVKLDLEQFQILYPPVPKQRNPNDCGIYSVMFLERWDVTTDLRRIFDFSDIENIRVKLANSLFFSSTNLVDKALVNGFYEEGLDPRLFK